MNTDSKILIVGIGSIGGIIAGKLVNNGYDCTLLTNNKVITQAIRQKGILIQESENFEPISIMSNKIFTDRYSLSEKFDYIFYTVKATSLGSAILGSKDLLKSTGSAVFFQNGIMESYISYFANPVIIASVVFNSIMVKPGKYVLSKSEKIIIGCSRSNKNISSLTDLRQILMSVTTCEISSNIIGILWSKLAINCSINAITAISGKPLGEVLRKKFGKELFLGIYKETIDIAQRRGIILEKIKIDPYLLYSGGQLPFYKKYLQIVIINQIAKNYNSIFPSMLQDIKKYKKTEINFLNGYISRLGREIGVSTPVNDEMTSLVRKIERGFLKPDISLLKIAYEQPKTEKITFNDLSLS